MVAYKFKPVRPLTNNSVTLDFEFVLSNYLPILILVFGTIILLWNLLIFVRYYFVFIPFNHDLSRELPSHHRLGQAKVTADILYNAYAVIVCLSVLESPLSITFYLFHLNLGIPSVTLELFFFFPVS